MLQKEEVLQTLISFFSERLKNSERSLKSIRGIVRDAPGSNVTHSDTTRFQQGNMALALEKQFLETKEALQLLKRLKSDRCETITLGALFALQNNTNQEINRYLLISKGGGYIVMVGTQKIATLGMMAPLARACIGKEEGDEIAFSEKTFQVLEVQ